MFPRIRVLGALLPLAVLAGCGGPSASDIEKLIGQPVKDVSCAEATGKSGYSCTFKSVKGPDWPITRNVVKGDNGWYLN